MDVTSSCKSPMNTGVQRVVRALYRSLAAIAPITPLTWDPALRSYCTLSRREHSFLVNPFGPGYIRTNTSTRPGDAEPGRRANPVPLWSKLARRVSHRWNQLDLPAAMTLADTLFVPEIFQDNRAAWLGALPALSAARRVGVCHDALPWRRPDLMPAAVPSTPPVPARRVGMFYDALTQRRPEICPPARQAGFAEYLDVLGGFDHIVTISEESAADLRACWRERGRSDAGMPPVSVFEWPVDHDGAPRQIVPPPAAPRPSVLCVGTFEPRKNHLLLLEAAESVWQARGEFELVLVGRTTAHWGARVETEIERLRCAGRPVRWLRHVDDATLRQAYDACAFTVFPSLVEGLGLPILESLWHGRPCICGTNGALGEVSAGGGCLPVDQTDTASLVAGLERLLTDQESYRRLCQEAESRSFNTWASLAAKLVPLLCHAR